MAALEIFIHRGCVSEQPTVALANEIRKEFPTWRVQVVENQMRAKALGIIAVPAFVLDGEVVAVGVPRKEWLVRELRDWNQQKAVRSSHTS